jgi:predicted nuclease with TOPRIM domain
VSRPEDKTSGRSWDREAFDRLEAAVEAALVRVETLRVELRASKEKATEMETLLRKFTGGEEDPASLLSRLQRLEDENGVLTERLRKGRDGVQRILARIRFLEEQG